MNRKGNKLINETSPYLLQHAYNPVDWHPWNQNTLKKAKKENKLLLISIGYSACHWCHVMEHESFEDQEVAKIMNDNFICVKVDREERPDIDQIYMTAVQLMNQRGGWPLNCITLPDGRPFWGGTYFRKEDWKEKILELAMIYQNESSRVVEFSEKLSQGIKQVEIVLLNKEEPFFTLAQVDKLVKSWSESFDNIDGGSKGQPKFPMPNAYKFLLRYGHLSKDESVLEHVNLTMKKMAYGGIYDQIGGGFSRYSVDNTWKVPHFEKMLYDNGQLVSLYCEAFLKFEEPLFKEVVFSTLNFIERELMSDEGAFYSALDADSEGEEGKFYVWNETELKNLIKEDFNIFKDYYNINKEGFWGHGNYILLRKESKEKIAKTYKITGFDLDKQIETWHKNLMQERDKRVRPGLDDKILTSWNGLMLKGYIDAYMTFGDQHYLEIALKNADFLVNNQIVNDGKLWHSYKEGASKINGFLEDYAFITEALISLYQATFDEKWLRISEKLVNYSLKHFYDNSTRMFYFTSDLDPELVARKMEIHDNVIPASNSVMANVLYDLGILLDNNDYKEISIKILNNIKPDMLKYISGYANYANLILKQVEPYYQVAIVGEKLKSKMLEINKKYIPNKLFLGTKNTSELDLLKGKYIKGSTMIYVCENRVCHLPTNNIMRALDLLK